MTDMIMPTHRVRILVATQPVDFRNYVAMIIMRSRVCRFVADAIFPVG